MYTLQGHVGAVNCANFSSDGHFWATGGADQLVMVWKSNLPGGRQSEPVFEWGQAASSAAGARAASASPTRPRPKALKKDAGGVNASSASIGSSGALKKVLLQQRSELAKLRASAEAIKPPAPVPAFAPAPAAAGVKSPSGSKIPLPARLSSPSSPKRTLPPAPPAFAREAAPSSLPDKVQDNLERILGQLDLLTKSVVNMSDRISAQERRVDALMSGQAAAGGVVGITEAGTFDAEEDEEEGGDV